MNESIFRAYLQLLLCVAVVSPCAAFAQNAFQGTGVYINPDGYVLTNKHVIKSGCTAGLFLEDLSGKRVNAAIARVSDDIDAALLKSLPRVPHAFFRVNSDRSAAPPLVLGEPVHIFGFPSGEFSPRGGTVSVARDPRHGSDGFSIGLKTVHGGSGSPVLDNSGLMIGLVWGIDKSRGDSHLAYSVNANALFPLLSQVRVGTATTQQAPLRSDYEQTPLQKSADLAAYAATVVVKVICLVNY